MAKAKKTDVHSRTYKGQVAVPAREECLRAYAELRDIDVAKAKNLKALDLTIEQANLDASGNPADPLRCTDCGMIIRDEDVFCPFCGGDVSENGGGGWDAYLAAHVDAGDEPADADSESTEEPGRNEDADAEPEQTESQSEARPVEKPKPTCVDAGPDKKGSDLPLKARVAKIIELETGLRKAGGEGAWDLGQELYAIHQSQRFTEGGFETFKAFCEAAQQKGGLGMSNAQALNYIRVFQVGSRELAARVGVMKLAMLANAPEAVKTKMLKPAADGSVPAEKLSKTEIQEKLKEVRASNREPGEPARGRPTRSKFAVLLEERRRTAKLNDGVAVFKLDEQVTLEVSVDLKEKKVSVQYVSPE